MNDQIEAIHEFWFGDMLTNPDAEDRTTFWYMGGEDVDRQIRHQFESLLPQAEAGKLDSWKETARGSLALIILLDQFPLNMYRRDPRAYAFEQQSVAVCLEGIDRGQDWELSFHERVFFYLPLEHSESVEHQKLSLKYFTQLREEAPEHLIDAAEGTLKFAIDHKATIDRFGRYPHRNKALGRESTAEEVAYLEGGGATYGQ